MGINKAPALKLTILICDRDGIGAGWAGIAPLKSL
jgi:hypothetical protein